MVALDGSALGIKTTVEQGYRFESYTASGVAPAWEGGDPTRAEQAVEVRGKADISAHVAPVEYSVPVRATLAFDLGGGTLDGKTGTITVEANVGDTIKLPDAPTREGYTFKFWKGSEYEAGADYEVEGDHAFTAEWEKNAPAPATKHTVTFDANGHGTAPAAQVVEDGKIAEKPSDPKADGWTFGGWYTDKACTNAYNFSDPVTADMTLYAKWTQASPDATKGTSAGSSPKTGDDVGGMVVALSITAACALCLALFAGLRRRRSGKSA